MFNIQLLIGGKDLPATGGRTFERRNPMSNAVASRAAAATIENANAAYAGCRESDDAGNRVHRPLGRL